MREDFFRNSGTKEFGNPFILPSTSLLPTDLETVLSLSRKLYGGNPRLQLASARTISHFVSKLRAVDRTGDKIEQDQKDYFVEQLQMNAWVRKMLLDKDVYGSAFGRVIQPFSRWLMFKDRKTAIPIELIPEDKRKFNLTDMTYTVKLPGSKEKVNLPFRDIPHRDPNSFKLGTFSPEDMVIKYNPYSRKKAFIWKIDSVFRQDVRSGNLFKVDSTPKHILDAIRNNNNILYTEDELCHIVNPWITDKNMEPWGMPTPIAIFSSLFQLQVYRKFDEASGLDHIIPFRVFTPNLGNSVSPDDINSFLSMSNYTGEVNKMIQNHRSSPFSVFSAPFPMNLQTFGTGADDMINKERIQYQNSEVMDSAGYPEEYVRGSMNLAQLPTSLRMFERLKQHIPESIATAVDFAVRKAQAFLGWDTSYRFAYEPPSYADDIDRKALLLDLAMGRRLSYDTALASFGVDNPAEERRKAIREDVEEHREELEAQQEMEAQMDLGLSPGGGEMANQGGGASTPVMDQAAAAEQKAMEWLSMPVGDRQRSMAALQVEDEALYALAKDYMDRMRRQGESQGRQMVYEQAQGGGPV